MKILIEEYNPRWAEDFLQEKAVIASTLHEFDPLIEHIGSTSVPGLCAKPTIDVLVGLDDESLLDQTIAPMIAAGYTYLRKFQLEMPYRRLYSRLSPLTGKFAPRVVDINDVFVRGQEFSVEANVHVLVRDTPHWRRHLAFRDYLRTHPDVRDQYGELKKELSRREFRDTNDYNAAKDRFIKEVESRAVAWYDRREADGSVD